MGNDADIQFPPGQRRDKPKFEPPPWEREMFDQLAHTKAESDVAGTEPEQQQLDSAPVQGEPRPAAESIPPAEAGLQVDEERPGVEPQDIDFMMMGLRSEEPRSDKAYGRVATIVGAVCVVIGLAMATWGLVAASTPKKAGIVPLLIVITLLAYGAGFMIGGGYVIYRSLRQQGVL